MSFLSLSLQQSENSEIVKIVANVGSAASFVALLMGLLAFGILL